MDENLYNSYDNPLDAIADELSQALNTTSVELKDNAADTIEAGQVSMRQSAARSIRASALHMEESAAGFVRATTVDAHESAMGALIAHEATIAGATTPVVVAQNVHAKDLQTVALFATRVEGNVQTVLTPLMALAMGAGFAVTLFTLQKVLPRLFASAKVR
ncbi:MAG: hypothetical protein R3C14_18765 [Caldilineaceae bacterium]